MALPSEIRELILIHLFDKSELLHLRCPKRCRLRSSRVDKDDVSGILSTCRLLRQEAVPVYFAVNVIRFHNSSDILDFLGDAKISPVIKENITCMVVDDGDIMDLAALKWAQVNATEAFTAMPRLRVLEFRAWARTDNAHYLANLNHLAEFWVSMKKKQLIVTPCAAPENATYYDLVAGPNPYGSAMLDALNSASVHVTIHESQEKYSTEESPPRPSAYNQNSDVDLKVCNLLLSKNANERESILGGAKMAVTQRLKVAGASHIKDDNVLERLTWGKDEWCWIDVDNPRALGERYH